MFFIFAQNRPMFTQEDIAEYYNTTQNHYKRWWNLNENLSLHYGIWDKETKSFSEALVNTNRILMEHVNVSANDKVLDAGCGVGGAAFFINAKKGAEVVGISLSKKQIDLALQIASERNLTDKVTFELMDYTKTNFPNESFDIIWSCESVCHANNKVDFINEAYRLLKKGGRLICAEYLLADENQIDKKSWIRKWLDTWSIGNIISLDNFKSELENSGFSLIQTLDYTKQIHKSAKRMYYASIIGALFSVMYNLFHPKVSRFAKTHYKSGYFQYKALKAGLWKYVVVLAIK